MLQKLLKYDLRHVFKYWWILAVASLGLSVVGGVCFNIIYSFTESEPTGIAVLLMIAAIFGMIVSILGISAFIIGNEIFIFERFYRNFFTDEGYLTFTLPVKRSDLLNSKILMAFIANVATFGVCILDIVVFFLISPIRQELFDIFGTGFSEMIASEMIGAILGITIVVIYFIIELILGSILGTLLIFACITVASVIAKKHKLLAAIGIYYVGSAIASIVVQVGATFTTLGLAFLLEGTPESLQGITSLIVIIVQILISAVLCLGLYTAQLRLLDKKLNLS